MAHPPHSAALNTAMMRIALVSCAQCRYIPVPDPSCWSLFMSTPQFPFSFDFLANQKLPEGTQQSAQEIWLAGLGAFAKAQKDGEKAFQTLVQDGVSMQKKNQEDTQRKLAEATEKMTALASDMAAKATGNFGKLEGIFEDRVARALKQLGVPTKDEMQALRTEVAALRAELNALGGKATKPAAKAEAKSTSAPTAKPKSIAKSTKTASTTKSSAVKKPSAQSGKRGA
jgi:poly(hydroxyalkanoate) granule-associated protein